MKERARLGLVTALMATAVILAAPSSSSAVGFGANLGRSANNTTTCNDITWTFPYANPYTSCSFSFQDLATGETSFPPSGQGVVNSVSVKVGPTTGPMQVVVEQALRKDNPGDPGHPTYACCQAILASQVFTPAAGTTTTVPVSLAVRQDTAPDPATGYYVDQHLALSVLAANVPIPANLDPNGYLTGWFPAWSVGDERAGGYGTSGGVILLHAEWAQSTTQSPAQTPAAATCPNAGKTAQAAKKKKKKKSPCAKKKKKKKKK